MTSRPVACLVALASTLACTAPPPASDGSQAVGTVFHDRNGDGFQDRFDRGLAGVAVSNGADVVRTDRSGHYRLPVDDDDIVFVVKPAGYSPSTDTDGVRRFYYVHKPAGSPPGLRFPGVAPTGPLPARIDFPLLRTPEPERFEVLLLGDPQPYTRQQLDWFAQDVVDGITGSSAHFGIVLGDIVGDDLDLLEPLSRVLGRVGIPWHYVLGNHDMNFRATGDDHSDETFERLFGPATYAFEFGAAHFIVLDDVIYRGHLEDGGSTQNYVGGLTPDRLRFVREYLRGVPADHLVVLAMHIPLVGESPTLGIAEHRELLAALAGHPHNLSIAGHRHTQRHVFLGAEHGWPGPEPHHHVVQGTTSGSWWLGEPDELGIPHTMMRDGTPNGHSVLTVDGSRYDIRYVVARSPASHQMNVFLPGSVAADDLAATEVVVNFFAGSEHSRVEMRVAPAERWVALERSPRPDPFFEALVAREAAEPPSGRRRLPPPEASPHLWVGRLPAGLAPGTHVLEVRATDPFAAGGTDRRIFRVE